MQYFTFRYGDICQVLTFSRIHKNIIKIDIYLSTPPHPKSAPREVPKLLNILPVWLFRNRTCKLAQ